MKLNLKKIRKNSSKVMLLTKQKEDEATKEMRLKIDDLFNDDKFISHIVDIIERTSNGEFIHERGGFGSCYDALITNIKIMKEMNGDSEQYLLRKFRSFLGKGFKCEIWGSTSVKISW